MQTLKIAGNNRKFHYLPSLKIDPIRSFHEIAGFKDQAFHAANYRCQACGIGTIHNLQLDHWYPHSKGGKTSQANVAVLCGGCNQVKGNVIPPEGIKPHTFTLTDKISVSECEENFQEFCRMVNDWRIQEQNGLVEYGKLAKNAGHRMVKILDKMLLSESKRIKINSLILS